MTIGIERVQLTAYTFGELCASAAAHYTEANSCPDRHKERMMLAMHLQWLNQHNIPFTVVMEYIPLVATITTTILSLVLARATLRYAESADKSLALAREEFERDRKAQRQYL